LRKQLRYFLGGWFFWCHFGRNFKALQGPKLKFLLIKIQVFWKEVSTTIVSPTIHKNLAKLVQHSLSSKNK
jgi:hypothetical protein